MLDLDFENFPRTVTDSRGAIYRLQKQIGSGGQGAVFTTSDGRVAVKLIAGSADSVASQIERLQSLPLTEPHISRPLVSLREKDGYSGYVMDLLADMTPIFELIRVDADDDAQFNTWYNVKTGGLRRRLILLARAAEILAWLHGRALVFADPSPNNILISSSLDREEVWLIDPDNIGVSEQDKGSVDPKHGTPVSCSVFTPGYGAPEVMRSESLVSTLTDAWGFAVLVFEVLTTLHPMIGNLVNDGPPEMETDAFSGLYPWIDDLEDHRNRCNWGVLRKLVLTRELQNLAQETFGPGRLDPLARPGVVRWQEALINAADNTLPCASCAATYYPDRANPADKCPWCDTPRPASAVIGFQRWVGPYEEPVFQEKWDGGIPPRQPWSAKALIPQSGYIVTARLAKGATGSKGHEPVLKVSFDKRGIVLAPLSQNTVWFRVLPAEEADFNKGSFHIVEGEQVLPWNLDQDHRMRAGYIHFGFRDESHYAAIVQYIPGVKG